MGRKKHILDRMLEKLAGKAVDALARRVERAIKGAGVGVVPRPVDAQQPAPAPRTPAQPQVTLNVFRGPTQVVVKRRPRRREPKGKPRNIKKALPKNARIIDADFEVKE